MPHPLAGQPAPRKILTNIPRLVSAYYTEQPNPEEIAQQVAFGTSGHRGTSLQGSFNEDHILAVCQALVEYRQQAGITGPLFIGKDTHALSEPAEATTIEVFAANGIEIRIADGFTPTPVVSHAILTYNRGRPSDFADGVVIRPRTIRLKTAASNTTHLMADRLDLRSRTLYSSVPMRSCAMVSRS